MGLSDHVLNIQQQKQAQQAQQSQQLQQSQPQQQQLQQTNNFKLYPPRPVYENGPENLEGDEN